MGEQCLDGIPRHSAFFKRTGADAQFRIEQALDKAAPLFGTLRELLCFTAILGFQLSRREELAGHTTAPIPEEVFAKNEDALSCVRMVALAHTKDYMIFAEERIDEMVNIFEEYALGGSRLLNHFLSELPTDILGAEALLEGLRKEKLLPPRSLNTGGGLGAVHF